MTELNNQQFGLCDIQGRLFELALKNGYDCKDFIEKFMNSKTAAALDETYDRLQWAGEEYLLEEIFEKTGDVFAEDGQILPKDILYWIGYLYRYWHYYTGETSAKIYKQAPVETMVRNYMIFHTMDPALAIEDLKEIYNQKQ